MTSPGVLVALAVALAAAAAIAGYRHNPHRRRRHRHRRAEAAARWRASRDAGVLYHARRVAGDPAAWADFVNAHTDTSRDTSEQ